MVVLDDADELAAAAAGQVVGWLREAVTVRGQASLALAGGSTPARLYKVLAGRDEPGLWPYVSLYFGDERAVGPDHEDSNYAMVNSTLLAGLAEAPRAVHRMEGERGQEAAAKAYAALLPQRLDVALLGMGEDGHTASLFPGRPEAERTDVKVLPAFGPKPPPERISLSLKALNEARQVAFLVTGTGKAKALAQVIEERRAGTPQLPSARVSPHTEVFFFVDRAAGSDLG
ncbi:MAG: 6-phosphogluconolactonase [Gammaproteobacteria bacterium]|nr:6-phosphogluconolactonase [Gammaproteobacteria bacterium]